MSAKRMGLGRGFDSLIPTELLDESFDPTAEQDERMSDLRHIKLSEIIADPDQPRRSFDEASLEELASSIREHGILQPIVVTPHEGGYMVVAGERRFRAATRAGLDKIPALVRTLSNQHKLELSLIENLQRRDLNPLETATAYLKLRDQFNLTLDQIGSRVGGKSPAAISNTLRLLRLPESAREALVEGKISEGQVRPLINQSPEFIERVLPKIIAEDWSARAVEQYVSDAKILAVRDKRPTDNTHPSVIAKRYNNRVQTVEKRLHTQVRVKTTSRGAGQIVITFKNDKDFERIAKILDKS